MCEISRVKVNIPSLYCQKPLNKVTIPAFSNSLGLINNGLRGNFGVFLNCYALFNGFFL